MANDPRPATATNAQDPQADTIREPIVIDLGKKDRKQVRKLVKGKPGRLMNRVEDAIEHLREGGELDADTQPILIVIRQRPKRRGGGRIAKMWGLG